MKEAPRNTALHMYLVDVERERTSTNLGRLYEMRRKRRLARTARKLKQARRKIGACYMYVHELYSNICEPSRLQARRDEVGQPLVNRGELLFEERVDLDFGLQDKLLANGVLTADVKSSQSSLCGARRLLDNTLEKSADFNLALRLTRQQHLLNYAWSSGIYNSKFGGDWPLTDRQMITLNINQEALVELMEMSPQLVEDLYSKKVLNKRHKEFINGQTSTLKQSETFLDILRRRNFRDYKKTIKCLCASNQKHIAAILKGGVVGRIHCFLRKPAKDSISTANIIADKCAEELSRWSVNGGNCHLRLTKNGLIDVKYDNGIVLYFHFMNRREFSLTKKIFQIGQMRTIVKADFRALLATNHISIVLKWPTDNFKRCDIHLLRRPFSETKIQNCPMEVLEIILSRAYALYFYAFSPHPPEKKLFALLSSVSRDWHKTIARHRFKSSLREVLSPYFLMVSKRNTIIRNNRRYLVESMEPSDDLISKMVQLGCLTVTEADFIAGLNFKSEKNQELLNIARSMNFKKHFAFIESLHSCGQLDAAKVIEKGGVVVMAKMIHLSVPNSVEFVKLVNEKITELNADYSENLSKLLELDKQETLEVLKIKQLGRIKNNERSMIYLLCKSQQSLRRIQKLLESDKLLKIFDILINCLNSKDTGSLRQLSGSFHYKKESSEFLKGLTIDTIQFQKEVAVRQMSLKYSGEFELPQFILAMTSLDDKIYILLEHLHVVSIHKDIAPFACQSRIVFPPPELKASSRLHVASYPYFMVACDETKCIYIANSTDIHIWRLTTPDNKLKVWLSDISDSFSAYVARNGHVVLLRLGDVSQAGMPHLMEIYNKDAILMHEIAFPSMRLEPCWGLEISPGKLALLIHQTLLVQGVNYRTLIADPDVIEFPNAHRRWKNTKIVDITSYCEGQILGLLRKRLALFDSQLNVNIIPTSNLIDAEKTSLYFKKDKRQLMIWSYDMNTSVIQIYTLAYEAEDMFAGNP